MSKKVMRTIYLSKEMDEYISERMKIEDRKRSSLVERMLQKCIELQTEKDLKIAMES